MQTPCILMLIQSNANSVYETTGNTGDIHGNLGFVSPCPVFQEILVEPCSTFSAGNCKYKSARPLAKQTKEDNNSKPSS